MDQLKQAFSRQFVIARLGKWLNQIMQGRGALTLLILTANRLTANFAVAIFRKQYLVELIDIYSQIPHVFLRYNVLLKKMLLHY